MLAIILSLANSVFPTNRSKAEKLVSNMTLEQKAKNAKRMVGSYENCEKELSVAKKQLHSLKTPICCCC